MITPVESTPVAVQTVRPAQTVTQIRIQTTAQPNAAANPRKGLSLTVNYLPKFFILVLYIIDIEISLLLSRITARTNVGSTRNV